MSLAVLANHMASKGRNGDTMLVHMTPGEVQGLHALALAHGEKLTINPETGLPEANILKSLLPVLAGAALNAFLPGVGTAIGSALGMTGAAAGTVGTGLLVGGVTGLATGSLQKGIMAGLGAYGGAGLAEGFMNAGLSAGAQEMATRAAGEAAGLGLEGQAASEFMASRTKDAIAANQALSPMERLTAGFSAAKEAPVDFLKNNARTLLTAGAPIIADQMVPTATKMPGVQPGDTGYVRSFQFNPYTQGLQYLGAVPANQIRPAPVNRAPAPVPAPAPYPSEQPPGGYNTGGIVALANGGEAAKLSPAQQKLYDLLSTIGGEGRPEEVRDYISKLNDAQALATLATRQGYSTYPTEALAYQAGRGAEPPPARVSAEYLRNLYQVPLLDSPFADLRTAPTSGPVTPWDLGRYHGQMSLSPTPAPAPAASGISALTTTASPAPAPATSSTTNTAASTGSSVGYETVAQQVVKGSTDTATMARLAKPTLPAFMKATGADFETASHLLDGVVGGYTGFDSRDWGAIMAAKDPLAAARAATGAMHGGVKLGEFFDPELNRYTPAVISNDGKVRETALSRAENWGLGATGGGAYVYSPNTLANYTKPAAVNPPVEDLTRVTSTAPTFTLPDDKLNTPTGTITGGTVTGGSVTGGSTATGPVNPITVSSAGTLAGYKGSDKIYGGNVQLEQQANAALGTPGKVYTGTDTMQQIRDAYTKGGGSLGMPEIKTPTSVLTGGSKQAYDYLMGTGPYPVSPYLPVGTPLMRPYIDTLEAAGRPAGPTVTLPKRPDRATALSVPGNTATGGAGVNTLSNTGGTRVDTGLQTWQNESTGEIFYSPKGGYAPQGAGWKVVQAAKGGLADVAAMAAARGGDIQQYNLGGYSDGGRLLRGPGDGVSDSIPATIGNRQPARLADGEFVIPARIVSEIGNGSTEAGARKLYAMMDRVQRARAKTTGKGKVAKNTRADKYLPA